MKTVSLINPAIGKAVALSDLLSYCPDTGDLTWLPRPREMFRNKQSFMAWNARYSGNRAFSTMNGAGYRHGSIFGKFHLAHRVALALVNGGWPDEVDHINGDRTDNRLENLRDASRTENARNMRRHSRNTSGVTGVFWHKQRGKWAARIMMDGSYYSLGLFANISDAIAARKAAEISAGYHENHGRST